jgi:hypothetical protein
MTTRFCYSPLDQLAKASDVRIIHPDRPGIGGTDQVEQHQRVAMWLGRLPPVQNVPWHKLMRLQKWCLSF